ncbi:hypothetical protein BDA96_01G258100 [Sorghum bicolor]|uniref:Uncharacterized protein n=1 Tax=Sorghum bicolor TaxID=4558 RepID=A0A921UZC5_SORBI|nr:hypothetical protein BDA96_01G258100 [Sorghum bicolor]
MLYHWINKGRPLFGERGVVSHHSTANGCRLEFGNYHSYTGWQRQSTCSAITVQTQEVQLNCSVRGCNLCRCYHQD